MLSRSELGTKSYIFMGNDKIILNLYYLFSKKFPNQCKEQTKGKVPS